MNTKTLALIIVFVALATALNIAGPKIPAPYAPFLFYQLWEIPIVLAFIAIGPKVGIAVTVINTLILFAVFNPGANAGPTIQSNSNPINVFRNLFTIQTCRSRM